MRGRKQEREKRRLGKKKGRARGRKAGRKARRKAGKLGGREGSETTTFDGMNFSNYILNNYSNNKRKILEKITIALQPQNNGLCLQTICLLIIQLLSPNLLNRFKCETHEMSFQFILRLSSWQSVQRIIGLSGLAIYKTRQKHKNLFFKC